MSNGKTIKVYEVLLDSESGIDGLRVYRTLDGEHAEKVASTHTYYGNPATVYFRDVAERLAIMWGLV